MKYILVCFFALIGISSSLRRDDIWPPPGFLEQYAYLRPFCEKETGVTDEAIKEFSDGEVHFDPKLKCYMKCQFVQVKIMDESTGRINMDGLRALLPPIILELGAEMLNNCPHPEGVDDVCQVAFDLHKCWKETDPHHYFFF